MANENSNKLLHIAVGGIKIFSESITDDKHYYPLKSPHPKGVAGERELKIVIANILSAFDVRKYNDENKYALGFGDEQAISSSDFSNPKETITNVFYTIPFPTTDETTIVKDLKTKPIFEYLAYITENVLILDFENRTIKQNNLLDLDLNLNYKEKNFAFDIPLLKSTKTFKFMLMFPPLTKLNEGTKKDTFTFFVIAHLNTSHEYKGREHEYVEAIKSFFGLSKTDIVPIETTNLTPAKITDLTQSIKIRDKIYTEHVKINTIMLNMQHNAPILSAKELQLTLKHEHLKDTLNIQRTQVYNTIIYFGQQQLKDHLNEIDTSEFSRPQKYMVHVKAKEFFERAGVGVIKSKTGTRRGLRQKQKLSIFNALLDVSQVTHPIAWKEKNKTHLQYAQMVIVTIKFADGKTYVGESVFDVLSKDLIENNLRQSEALKQLNLVEGFDIEIHPALIYATGQGKNQNYFLQNINLIPNILHKHGRLPKMFNQLSAYIKKVSKDQARSHTAKTNKIKPNTPHPPKPFEVSYTKLLERCSITKANNKHLKKTYNNTIKCLDILKSADVLKDYSKIKINPNNKYDFMFALVFDYENV